MKIACLSDIHGNLIDIPPCDLAIVAGDLCPATDHSPAFQRVWLDSAFRHWLENMPAEQVVYIAGNHDFIFQDKPQWVPKDLPGIYLQDSGYEFQGLNIWGSPWQPVFFDWAFNLREPQLKEKWDLIPDNTNILTVHGPPRGYGDWVSRNERTGSPSLTARIEQLRDLKLSVHGHIHPQRGLYRIDDTIVLNASILDDHYNVANEPFLLEI